jgi:hypothetical protein
MHFDSSTSKYEVPRKSKDSSLISQKMQISQINTDTTYESVGPAEIVYERRNTSSTMNVIKSSASIDAPPLPPPLPPILPPLLLRGNPNVLKNSSRDSNDSLDESIDFNQNDADLLESDSGLEVVEEPTLRPSELVRGNNNRSMSIISGLYNNNQKFITDDSRKLPMTQK